MNESLMSGLGFLVMGYLIGSVSFARLVFALKRPKKAIPVLTTPTTDGQAALVAHAVGATNVMLAFGSRWGLLTTLMDVLKGFVPVLVLRMLMPETPAALVCGVGILVGHLWPIWYRFVGGGGNSSIMGMHFAISPIGMLITQSLGMMLGRRYPMVAFLGGIVLAIPWMMVQFGPFSLEAVFALILAIIYVVGQLPEAMQIRQLRRDGHQLDFGHIMRQMKSATVQTRSIKPSPSSASNPLETEIPHDRSAR
jgi:acyl phosphate:glycerol-3-phosphate acyltransferase